MRFIEFKAWVSGFFISLLEYMDLNMETRELVHFQFFQLQICLIGDEPSYVTICNLTYFFHIPDKYILKEQLPKDENGENSGHSEDTGKSD